MSWEIELIGGPHDGSVVRSQEGTTTLEMPHIVDGTVYPRARYEVDFGDVNRPLVPARYVR